MSNVNQMSDYAPNMSWTTRTGPKYVYFPCLLRRVRRPWPIYGHHGWQHRSAFTCQRRVYHIFDRGSIFLPHFGARGVSWLLPDAPAPSPFGTEIGWSIQEKYPGLAVHMKWLSLIEIIQAGLILHLIAQDLHRR